jgi:flagellar M-ring protein FliF
MNQQLREFKDNYLGFWKSTSNKKKMIYISLFISIIAALSLSIYFVSKPSLVPLYSNELSQKEIGDIKAELDREGYMGYELAKNGTTILVPQEDVADLQVAMATKGLPKTGSISFYDMTKELQFGATDRQLDAMEKEALQGEVENLLKHVEGVKNAAVVISSPEESLFAKPDDSEKASASVVIELEPGYNLEPSQIKVLYHLVGKSIPNLPKENIMITDQAGQWLEDPQESTSSLAGFEQQRQIQRDIEADIQKSLKQMLGTIIGQDKVLIQSFVRLNFDQVKTHENRVEPGEGKENEGIAVSVEEISKSYTGNSTAGVTGTGEGDVSSFGGTTDPTETTNSEELEKRVNYEVNRITNEIVQSPYKIEDLTINVGVEPPNPADPASLTNDTKNSIQQIVSNVVRTALSDNANLTDADINSRITVFAQEFNGKAAMPETKEIVVPSFPTWAIYALIAAGVALLLLVLVLVIRSRKKAKAKIDPEDPFAVFEQVATLKQIGGLKQVAAAEEEEEIVTVKKQIEQMAMQSPDEFVGLLRNWLTRD